MFSPLCLNLFKIIKLKIYFPPFQPDEGLAVGAAVVNLDKGPSDLSADKPADQTSDLSAGKPTDQTSAANFV